MTDIERQAAFYLGREYDPQTRQPRPDVPVMYDARDLTTHAVCIGMTGSGKTGLGVDLLEEAALDGLPAIVIDPKGDMTNLLLTFPELRPADFEPWVNADDARRKGQSEAEYAAGVADTWRRGLADWGQDGERIRRLRQAAEFAIYTPGSDAGLPISVMQSLRAPALSWDDDEETLREMISGIVAGLLGLVGIAADPVRSREHILLANVFEHAWRRGEDLDLARVIAAIQQPPMARLGVLDLDTFYPQKERLELAMALNAVVAAPSFENWLEGAPLDIATLLRAADGRPRVSVFYIAHLSEAERSFFVTLLLEQVITWMRGLSGTTSLRCLLYFDELFGFFPPHPANPPSKRPLLTLLKTARAFGLGCVLTTQNPVDLDYKGLTNAGTWFIGKLQTDRDKARVLEGMEGVVAEAGTLLDRAYLDRLISSLDSRVFILHNVHGERPQLMQTRWALSYLRGPLTRSQVRTLMKPLRAATPTAQPATAAALNMAQPAGTAAPSQAVASPSAAQAGASSPSSAPEGYSPVQPRVHARVAQYFVPVERTAEAAWAQVAAQFGAHARLEGAHLIYEPHLAALATVLYGDRQAGAVHEERVAGLAPLPDVYGRVDWARQTAAAEQVERVGTAAPAKGYYAPLPSGMADSPPYTRLRDEFVEAIYRDQQLTTWEHPTLKLQAAVGETERDFKARCQEEARSRRDAELAALQTRQEREVERLRERLKKAEQSLEDKRVQHQGRKQEELLSAGETVVGFLLGRKRSSALSQASRKRRMTEQARLDIEQLEAEVARLKSESETLLAEQQAGLQAVRDKWSDEAVAVREATVRPRKTDIRVDLFGLAWVPQWRLAYRGERGPGETTAPAGPLG